MVVVGSSNHSIGATSLVSGGVSSPSPAHSGSDPSAEVLHGSSHALSCQVRAARLPATEHTACLQHVHGHSREGLIAAV